MKVAIDPQFLLFVNEPNGAPSLHASRFTHAYNNARCPARAAGPCRPTRGGAGVVVRLVAGVAVVFVEVVVVAYPVRRWRDVGVGLGALVE